MERIENAINEIANGYWNDAHSVLTFLVKGLYGIYKRTKTPQQFVDSAKNCGIEVTNLDEVLDTKRKHKYYNIYSRIDGYEIFLDIPKRWNYFWQFKNAEMCLRLGQVPDDIMKNYPVLNEVGDSTQFTISISPSDTFEEVEIEGNISYPKT